MRISIVSPSGNYYGSEQVLHDFLKSTHSSYDIYVPKGKFHNILKQEKQHTVHSYRGVKSLYGLLMSRLLLNKIDGLYVNEAGHSRYVRILAKIFPHKKFFLHIRLLEDCDPNRIGNMPDNVTLISVSDYITRELNDRTRQKAVTITDVYELKCHRQTFEKTIATTNIQLGIVGRVTDTKGLNNLIDFCNYAEKKTTVPLTLNFYGDINTDSATVCSFMQSCSDYNKIKCLFHGYVNGSENIYSNIDVLLHFNEIEPLGRIAFEALDYGVPFIGFNAGGIGEIAHMLNLEDLMVNSDARDFAEVFLRKIECLNNISIIRRYASARARLSQLCSPLHYTHTIESLFSV